MLTRLPHLVHTWIAQRRNARQHSETLMAYQKGDYPENPSIGIGQAFLDGILDRHVLCKYAWTQKALHEGPAYLEAWRKASMQLKITKKERRYAYSAKNALDVAMSAHEMKWKKGWPAQYEGDTRSPAMRLVEWVHNKDPHWIGGNLDVTFFSSSMSVWDTLLYHDISTSAWVMERWPERLEGNKLAWTDWLADTTPWMYPLISKSFSFSKQHWEDVANHIAQWSPLRTLEPAKQLQEAFMLLDFPGKNFRPNDASHRGLLWKALTRDVPTHIADPIGAALACAWPDMHPNDVAIKRLFYPELENTTFASNASLPNEAAFSDRHAEALATAFLYDSPQAWVKAMLDTWGKRLEGVDEETVTLALPSNLLD